MNKHAQRRTKNALTIEKVSAELRSPPNICWRRADYNYDCGIHYIAQSLHEAAQTAYEELSQLIELRDELRQTPDSAKQNLAWHLERECKRLQRLGPKIVDNLKQARQRLYDLANELADLLSDVEEFGEEITDSLEQLREKQKS